jgi:hypothetical protein
MLLVLASAALAGAFYAKAQSPATAYLDAARGTGWIVPGLVKNAGAYTPAPAHVTFFRTIEAAGPGERPTLELRVLGTYEVRLDGVRLATSPDDQDRTWRRVRMLPLRDLAAGSHLLEVVTQRGTGPPALWARGGGDGSWSYTINGSSPATALPAGEPWIGASYDSDDLERSIVWGRPWLTIGVGAACLLSLLLARRAARTSKEVSPRAPRWAIAALVAIWLALLAVAAARISPWAGFDVDGHMEYIDWILAHGSLPYPTQGWQMYQPPLYYVLGAGWLSLFGAAADSVEGVRLLRILNMGMAAAFLVAAGLAARRLLAARTGAATMAVLFAGTAPAAFYLFAYVTNENLCTLAASLVFLALARLRGRRVESLGTAACVGAVLGAALLSKATALVLIVPVVGAYLLRAIAQGRAGRAATARRVLGRLAMALAVALLISGWHFARIQARFGTPVVGNWDAESGQPWWDLPGFRTWTSYVPDGTALGRPFYAGLEDVWSGFVTTWASDALGGGSTHVNTRPPWNYELTAVSIALSLIFAGLILVGIVSRVRWRRLTMPRLDACLLGTLLTTGVLMLWMTLTVPAYAQAKAFYGLTAVVPCAVFAARGAGRLLGRARDRALAAAMLCAPWAVVLVGTFLILPRAENETLEALQLNTDGETPRAIERLERVVAERPDDMNARVMLATLLFPDEREEARVRELIDERRLEGPMLGRRLDLLGQLALRAGHPTEASGLARRAVALAPGRPRFWLHAIDALASADEADGAIALAKDAIRWHPWTPEIQRRIGELYERAGRPEDALGYRRLERELGTENGEGR